jgi:hypothetical protein
MTDPNGVETIVSLGAEDWGLLRSAISRLADAIRDIGEATTGAADGMDRFGDALNGLDLPAAEI